MRFLNDDIHFVAGFSFWYLGHTIFRKSFRKQQPGSGRMFLLLLGQFTLHIGTSPVLQLSFAVMHPSPILVRDADPHCHTDNQCFLVPGRRPKSGVPGGFDRGRMSPDQRPLSRRLSRLSRSVPAVPHAPVGPIDTGPLHLWRREW